MALPTRSKGDNVDLHSHSNISDGLQTPTALGEHAAQGNVTVWALTDHDELSGLKEARGVAERLGLHFIDGVEISVTWSPSTRKSMTTIHIVGLQIDPDNPELRDGLASIRLGRESRAVAIAQDLQRVGIPEALAGARRHVSNPDLVSRTHFARYLVECGKVSNTNQAFAEYLVEGKPGYVEHCWADLADAVRWIRAAGGVAVIAHPGRYRLSTAEMGELCSEFLQHGGLGIEVVTGSHYPEQVHHFSHVARHYGFLASRGSDYHGPGEGRVTIGMLPPLPEGLKPVWHDWF